MVRANIAWLALSLRRGARRMRVAARALAPAVARRPQAGRSATAPTGDWPRHRSTTSVWKRLARRVAKRTPSRTPRRRRCRPPGPWHERSSARTSRTSTDACPARARSRRRPEPSLAARARPRERSRRPSAPHTPGSCAYRWRPPARRSAWSRSRSSTSRHGQPARLSATLEPHRRTWLVVAIERVAADAPLGTPRRDAGARASSSARPRSPSSPP